MTQQLETRLKTRLQELETRLEKVSRDASSEHSHDSAEQAQERENDEVIDGIGAETRLAIVQLRHALERLENGEYGICQACGEEISAGRLEAVPEATHCVKCAN